MQAGAMDANKRQSGFRDRLSPAFIGLDPAGQALMC
jgi:hypothetical protein